MFFFVWLFCTLWSLKVCLRTPFCNWIGTCAKFLHHPNWLICNRFTSTANSVNAYIGPLVLWNEAAFHRQNIELISLAIDAIQYRIEKTHISGNFNLVNLLVFDTIHERFGKREKNEARAFQLLNHLEHFFCFPLFQVRPHDKKSLLLVQTELIFSRFNSQKLSFEEDVYAMMCSFIIFFVYDCISNQTENFQIDTTWLRCKQRKKQLARMFGMVIRILWPRHRLFDWFK